jgi:endonuclease YncB( thermonuclease family)
MVAFYKRELWSSHIIDKAKQQLHYGTKWYRKFVEFDFPSSRRYKRLRAIVSSSYKKSKKKYNVLAQL